MSCLFDIPGVCLSEPYAKVKKSSFSDSSYDKTFWALLVI